MVGTVHHGEILARVEADAGFTVNYAFMVAMAAGIATIGLLLNSPAVIIGAMLISPLMGPIIGAGFAIAGFDVDLGRQGARALLLGAIAAAGFAAAIVLLSPVREVTSEILARTRPNLLDLAVAILSGAAGGYGMIRGRGGAIVGVAIATALMPPLAVVGYGLATWQWHIARGALLLFVTNMAAIALAVAAVAEWYGFGRGGLRKRFARQALISLVVLAPLAYPLYYSLKGIAWESRVHSTVRTILEASVQRLPHGQLAQLSIKFADNELPLIDAIIVSDQTLAGLDTRLRAEIQLALGGAVDLHLTQLQADDPAKLAAVMEKQQRDSGDAVQVQELAAAIRSEIPFPLSAVEINAAQKSVTVVPGARNDLGLGAWRDMESRLASLHGDWKVILLPPPIALPSITFEQGRDDLGPAAQKQLALVVWALQRWGLQDIEILSNSSGNTRKDRILAVKRRDAVAKWFDDHHIAAHADKRDNQPRKSARKPVAGFEAVELLLPALRSSDMQRP